MRNKALVAAPTAAIGREWEMSGKPAGMIALPSEMCLEEGADMQALSDWVFPDLATRSGDVGYMLSQRAAPLSGR